MLGRHYFLICCQALLQRQHSFPTRRSSDLTATGNELRGLMSVVGLIVSQGHAVMRQGVVRELLDTQHEHLGDELHLRSEEHTSELQSRPHLVCRLLPAKKKIHYYAN